MVNIENAGEIFINRKLKPMIVRSINITKGSQPVVIEEIYDKKVRNYCEKNGNYYLGGLMSTEDLVEKLNSLKMISDSSKGITCLFDYVYVYVSYENKNKTRYDINIRSANKDSQLYEIPYEINRKEELLAEKSKRSIVKLETDVSILKKLLKLKQKID